MSDTTYCPWTEVVGHWSDGHWETGCGEAFNFFDGGPIENRMNYCPYCGKPLSAKYSEEADHGEEA